MGEMTDIERLCEIIKHWERLWQEEYDKRNEYQRKYESLLIHHNEKMQECRKTCDFADAEMEK